VFFLQEEGCALDAVEMGSSWGSSLMRIRAPFAEGPGGSSEVELASWGGKGQRGSYVSGTETVILLCIDIASSVRLFHGEARARERDELSPSEGCSARLWRVVPALRVARGTF
jgi:hypothetical protein